MSLISSRVCTICCKSTVNHNITSRLCLFAWLTANFIHQAKKNIRKFCGNIISWLHMQTEIFIVYFHWNYSNNGAWYCTVSSVFSSQRSHQFNHNCLLWQCSWCTIIIINKIEIFAHFFHLLLHLIESTHFTNVTTSNNSNSKQQE